MSGIYNAYTYYEITAKTLQKDQHQSFCKMYNAGIIAIYFLCHCIFGIRIHAICVVKQIYKGLTLFSKVSQTFISNTHRSHVLYIPVFLDSKYGIEF